MIYPNDISSLKTDIEEKVGQKIIVKGSLGRNRPFEKEATLEKVYPSIFVVKYDENQILSSLTLTVFIFIFFMTGLMYSLRKYNYLKPVENVKQSIETCFYLVFLWFPIVVFIIFKIIFKKKTMDWGKTAHGQAKGEQPALVK